MDQFSSTGKRKYKSRSCSYSIKNTTSSNEMNDAENGQELDSLLNEPIQPRKLSKAEMKKMVFSNFEFDRPNPFYEPVKISLAPTHSNLSMTYDSERLVVSNPNKGYRMCKATHGVETGRWYYEVEIPSTATGHFRIGWSQILGDVHAPVGFDEYSYSYRDVDGGAFHVSRGKPYGQSYGPSDVIGCMIEIPKIDENLSDKAKVLLNEIQSKYPPKKEGFYKVSLEVLPGSNVSFFVNGKPQGVAFSNLYNAKYYPAVSVYMGGPAKINFGPTFQYSPGNISFEPVSSLYINPNEPNGIIKQ